MPANKRIVIFALCGLGILFLIALATALGTAVPLFFTWIPASLMMVVENRPAAA